MATQNINQQPLCNQYPPLTIPFELKSGLIYLLPNFSGIAGEDPHKHLKEFHVVWSTMKPREVTEEQIKLRAFPFLLADKAKDWLYYLPFGSITTWDQMKQQFLEKFFPASCAVNIRKDICGIRQFNGEMLYEYWERSKQECLTKSVSEVKTSYDQRLDNLTALVEKLVMGNSTQQVKACGICSVVGHLTDMCPTLQDGSPEQMNADGEIILTLAMDCSNNFQQQYPKPTTHSQPSSSNSSMSLEDIVKMLATSTQQFQQDTKSTIQHLENQIGQLATSVNRLESQASGKLPSQTVNNPKHNVSAITLRSGKVLEEQPLKPSKRDLEKEIVKEGSSKKQEQEKEILETFRKVEVNIPHLDAIKQVPRYAKFLKELCTSKRKLKGNEKVLLRKNVSAMIQKKLPIKCKDPCMFTIPCKMGNVEIERAMLDLGASINVMPNSIYEAMNVKDLVFPTDFYVVDMGNENHSNTPSILLWRPFLKTTRTNICAHKGTLTMEFDGQLIKFNIYDSMKYPGNEYSVFSIDVIDSLVQKVFKLNDEDSLKVALTNTISQSENKELEPNSNLQEAISRLNSLAPVNKIVSYLGLPLNNAKLLPSIVQAPKLELKKLHDHLKYLFLGEGDTLPVISSTKLTPVEDERLIRILRDYKEAIGWTVADISGISPFTCMHKILLEERATPSKQVQRRLNPPIMEVVKKEIQKLMDA
ncbi:uncharacterized protein Tco_0927561, partial [Tanacetum coccineum]